MQSGRVATFKFLEDMKVSKKLKFLDKYNDFIYIIYRIKLKKHWITALISQGILGTFNKAQNKV